MLSSMYGKQNYNQAMRTRVINDCFTATDWTRWSRFIFLTTRCPVKDALKVAVQKSRYMYDIIEAKFHKFEKSVISIFLTRSCVRVRITLSKKPCHSSAFGTSACAMILIAITKLTVYICKTEAPHATTPLCSPATLPLDASSAFPFTD